LLDISARIERSFSLHRRRQAICIEGRLHSYDELRSRSLCIQHEIESAVDQPLIGVVAGNNFDTYAAILAILRAGRGFVPINPHHPEARNQKIIADAGLKTILIPEPRLRNQFAASSLLKIVVTEEATLESASPAAMPGAETIAYLLFTSGSTGAPKGVPITRANLCAFLDSLTATGFGFTSSDRVLQMFDLTFDFSIASYLAPLSCGASVYTLPSGTAKFTEVYRLLDSERLTVAPMVPSVLSHLRPYFSEVHLPDLRLTILCGETLLVDLANEWMHCAPISRMTNFYGPTEGTVFAMIYEWSPDEGRSKSLNGIVSIGRPMPENISIVVDRELNPVPVGAIGELCLAGPQITPGYWLDPLRNAQSFFELLVQNGKQRFYRTGDMVVADSQGDHLFRGRIDTQIKIQGFRVELGEIEFHAREVTAGHACVVIHRVQASGRSDFSLVVENYPGDLKSVISALRVRIPPYMVPTRAMCVEKLPLNTNGKIDRLALRHRLEERFG
jgi:amino acid adenylation domain-containing protein